MPRPRRSTVSIKREVALHATRVSLGKDRLVYVLIADKRLKYAKGKSRIAYIGTTKKGLSRIASSVAGRADAILNLHGVRSFHARIVTCKGRRRVAMWRKLERALLIEFRAKFGEPPRCNSHGKGMRAVDEFLYFARTRIRNVLEDLA